MFDKDKAATEIPEFAKQMSPEEISEVLQGEISRSAEQLYDELSHPEIRLDLPSDPFNVKLPLDGPNVAQALNLCGSRRKNCAK